MNMVYLESDCYGLFIKKNELDCAQSKNICYHLIAANNIKQAYLNMAFR